jgi:hypothetical protein
MGSILPFSGGKFIPLQRGVFQKNGLFPRFVDMALPRK